MKTVFFKSREWAKKVSCCVACCNFINCGQI